MADSEYQAHIEIAWKFYREVLGSPQLVVAPMVDQSELAWRLLSRRYGAQLTYTPMFHAAMFIRDAHYRKEMLTTSTKDRPLIVQFCANNPETLVKAGLLVQDRCDAIDLNLGCPQSIAKRGHYGAFLQDEWDLICEMISQCKSQLRVPITAKIRIFPDVARTVEYARRLEAAGAYIITVHGRPREQKGVHTGLADWEQIKAVKEALKIPVFANGNIQYMSDVERCLKETGVDGVMSAEGNLHNPALFSGTQPCVWDMATEYLELARQYPCPLPYVRGHVFKLLHHALYRHLDVREVVADAKSIDIFETAVERLKSTCGPDKCASEDVNLPYPHWICQPYMRPPPADDGQSNGVTHPGIKRPADDISNLVRLTTERRERKEARKVWKASKEAKSRIVELCTVCSNPRGVRCPYKLCRKCCLDKTKKEKLVCPSHNKFKSRTQCKDNDCHSETGKTDHTTCTTVSYSDLLPT